MTTATRALQVTTRGDREIVMTRVFDAPRTLVWDAFTKPELLKRWLYGPGDWSLPVCEYGKKAGDRYRYVWRDSKGAEMAAGGAIREFIPPERLVVTERADGMPAVALVLVLSANGAQPDAILAALGRAPPARAGRELPRCGSADRPFADERRASG